MGGSRASHPCARGFLSTTISNLQVKSLINYRGNSSKPNYPQAALPRWEVCLAASTVAQFLESLFMRPILFASGPPAALNVSSPRFLFLETTPFSYPVPFSSSTETSPPLRRRCLQAKFTAAPGLSLRRCRPGAGMAEAVDRALFICRGVRLSDSLACLPLDSSVLTSGLAGGLGSPRFVICGPGLRGGSLLVEEKVFHSIPPRS